MRKPLALAVAALAAAGCGGGSETADQRLGRWQSQADAACREAQSRITERGRPAHLRDLDRITLRAVGDARAAIKKITSLPLPEGSESRVRPFVDHLKAVEPRLEELVASGEFADPVRMLVAVDKVQRPAEALEGHAKRAGLLDCAPQGFATRLSDALLTPLFVEQLERTRRKIAVAFRRANRLPTATWIQQREYFRELGWQLGFVEDSFGSLYPPTAAVDALERYRLALGKSSDLAWQFSDGVSRQRTIVNWRPINAHFRRLARRQDKAYERILKAVA